MQEQVFAAEGITIQPVCSAEEIEVITVLIENGFSISVLPYMDIVHLHNLVAIPVQTPIWKSKFYREKKIWKPLRGNFFDFDCGKCSWLLHMQMVRSES